MEELRDERLSKIIGWLQSYIRGYIARKDFKKLQDQRLVNYVDHGTKTHKQSKIIVINNNDTSIFQCIVVYPMHLGDFITIVLSSICKKITIIY